MKISFLLNIKPNKHKKYDIHYIKSLMYNYAYIQISRVIVYKLCEFQNIF